MVRERAQGYCEYCICCERYATERFSTEHIIAIAAGGVTTKTTRRWRVKVVTALSTTTSPRLIPLQNSASRFTIHATMIGTPTSNGTLITRSFGVTPIGRATIAALDLNREGVVNLRQVMALAGKHPPAHRASAE